MEAPGWRRDVHGDHSQCAIPSSVGMSGAVKDERPTVDPLLYIVNFEEKKKGKKHRYPNGKRAPSAVCHCFSGRIPNVGQPAYTYTNTWRLLGALRQIEFKLEAR
jgi:hypothetical protein